MLFGSQPAAQAPQGPYQMFVTSGSNGGPFAYLLNVQTGALRFCGAATGATHITCLPVATN